MGNYAATTVAPEEIRRGFRQRQTARVLMPDSDLGPVYAATDGKDSQLSSGMSSCWDFYRCGCTVSPDAPALGQRMRGPDGSLGAFEWITYNEVIRLAGRIGSGITHLGLCKESRFQEEFVPAQSLRIIVTLMPNRLQGNILDAAACAYGFTMCPCYSTLPKDSIVFIVNETETDTIFTCESLLKIAIDVAETCSSTSNVVCVDSLMGIEARIDAAARGVRLLGWEDLLHASGEVVFSLSPATRADVQTICYTSGTTGKPKGVLITHGMWLEQVLAICEGPLAPDSPYSPVDGNAVCYSYLPSAHCFERHSNYFVILRGGRIAISSGNMTKMIEEIQMVNPTFLPTVPRICNRFHSMVMAKVAQKSMLKRAAFHCALRLKREAVVDTPNSEHSFWDRLIFDEFRGLLGNRLRFFVNGGAVLDAVIQSELRSIFSITLFTGYGMTETTGGCMIVRSHDTLIGHDGAPLRGVQLRLRSVKEMNYSVHDDPPRGELLVRGKQVTPGYFRNPEATRDAIADGGWLCTGDVARRNADGTFKIIDRAKAVFKLTQGEFVSPERVENIYCRADFISQLFCYGDSARSFLVGIAVIDPTAAKKWAAEAGKQIDADKQYADPNLKEAVFAEMNEVAELELRGFEKIKAIELVADPFTVESGLVTATMKLKRPQLKARYRETIDRLYTEASLKCM